jgi:anti-sigma B factor antagonist
VSSTQPSEEPNWSGPHGFSCTSFAEGPGVVRVALGGELDLSKAYQLVAAAQARARGDIALLVLDLSELTFMDSTGLHALLTARARLGDAGCRLVLVPGRGQVKRLLELTGVDRWLEFVRPRDVPDVAAIPLQ